MADQQECLSATGFEFGAIVLAAGWFNNLGGDVTVQSTTKRSGTYALKVKPTTATEAIVGMQVSPTVLELVGRLYIYFATLPDADCTLFYSNTSSGSGRIGLAWNNTTSKIRPFDSFGTGAVGYGSDGPTPSTGTWYRVDFQRLLDTATTPDTHTWKWQWDGVAQTNHTKTGDTGAIGDFFFGNRSASIGAANYEEYFDDVYFGNDSNSANFPTYPVGAGVVVRLAPNGEGTHSNATDFADDAGTSPPGTPHTRVDEVPISATDTDFFEQTTANAASYIELTFDDLPSDASAIHGVCGYLIGVAEANAVHDFTVTWAGVTGLSSTALSPPNSTTRRVSANGHAKSPQYTVADVNALVARCGNAADIVPEAHLHNLWLEVAYGVGASNNDGWGWGDGQERWSYV